MAMRHFQTMPIFSFSSCASRNSSAFRNPIHARAYFSTGPTSTDDSVDSTAPKPKRGKKGGRKRRKKAPGGKEVPSPTETESAAKPKKDDEKKPGKLQQIKMYIKEYKWVFLAYWTGTWAAGAVVCYGALEVTGVDGIGILRYLGSDNIYDISGWNPKIVNGFLAIEINEFLELVRFPVILATTPKLAKWWRSEK
jgi:hypothetical protein